MINNDVRERLGEHDNAVWGNEVDAQKFVGTNEERRTKRNSKKRFAQKIKLTDEKYRTNKEKRV